MKILTLSFLLFSFLAATAPLSAQDLSKEEIEQIFRVKVKEKINLLQLFIQTIGDKNTGRETLKRTIRSATGLFSEGATIEVSNKNGTVERQSVEDYFSHLYKLPYDQVEISFEDNTVGMFRKTNSGNYQVDGTIFQRFTGIKRGKTVYSDFTIKNIEIEIEKVFDLNTPKGRYEIVLHNITVVETH
ncbi:MAG: hypothetical protein IPH04_19365 [Saprospirales bacterium]|nr:hypothetical protein [Saprospirales bacterium]